MKKMLVAFALLGFIACKSKNQLNTQQSPTTEPVKVGTVDSPKIQNDKDSLLNLNKPATEQGPKEK